MITRNSINLKDCDQECFAKGKERGRAICLATNFNIPDDHICNYTCRFYKPEDCNDWIRVEDKDGINLIPPEEYKYGKENKAKIQTRNRNRP